MEFNQVIKQFACQILVQYLRASAPCVFVCLGPSSLPFAQRLMRVLGLDLQIWRLVVILRGPGRRLRIL